MHPESMSIGQVAATVGVNVETIRYYQRLGLVVEPVRPSGGIRRYDNSFVARMRFIVHAKALGFALIDIKELLLLDDGNDCAAARQIAEQKLGDIESRLEQLQAMRAQLKGLVSECRSAKGRIRCPLIASLGRHER
jgi:MerR family mercuric resistance operon transcriptional regulator